MSLGVDLAGDGAVPRDAVHQLERGHEKLLEPGQVLLVHALNPDGKPDISERDRRAHAHRPAAPARSAPDLDQILPRASSRRRGIDAAPVPFPPSKPRDPAATATA